MTEQSEAETVEYPGEDLGPLLGYGCDECEEWWQRGEDTHPITAADDHARRRHNGDRSSIVEVRDEKPFQGGDS